MVDVTMFSLLLLLQSSTLLVSAATTHNVTVGVEGSFYVPPTVSAGMGDTVNFIFGGDIHDITQSTPQNPCSPLPGGFSSGLLGRGPNFDEPTKMWTLTITNASMPLWFFCAATMPVSHCESGMVGAINPPSQDAYSSFVAAAKLVSTTPVFSPSLVINGVGATASAPITISDTFPTGTASLPTPQSTASVLSSSNTALSSTSTSTPSPTASSSNRGAVIGGAVGAALGVVVLFCIGAFLCFRVRKHRRQSTDSSFFAYNHRSPLSRHNPFPISPPHTAISTINATSTTHSPNYITAFDVERETMAQRQPLFHSTSMNRMVSEHTNNSSMTANTPLQPQRHLPHTNSAGQLSSQNSTSQGFSHKYNQPSQNQDVSFGVTPATTAQPVTHNQPTDSTSNSEPGVSDGVDIKALAKEVAAVLKEEKSSEVSRGEGPDMNRPDILHARSPTDSLQSAPPKYHTVNNTDDT